LTQAPDPPRRGFVAFLRGRLQRWLARHQLPFNLAIHMIGIPLAVAGVVLLCLPAVAWYWGVGGLFVGYFLQWVGHTAEGNDVGEWAGIKALLGLPYVGVSPRWQKEAQEKKA
jgi:hypothetical protein